MSQPLLYQQKTQKQSNQDVPLLSQSQNQQSIDLREQNQKGENNNSVPPISGKHSAIKSESTIQKEEKIQITSEQKQKQEQQNKLRFDDQNQIQPQQILIQDQQNQQQSQQQIQSPQKKKYSKMKVQNADYSEARLKKIKEIEKFLLEQNTFIPEQTGIISDVKFLDEKDLHAGDFVFQLYNPDFPDFEYSIQDDDINLENIFSQDGEQKDTKVSLTKIGEMVELALHAETNFEVHRNENELITLALYRIIKRISDYNKAEDKEIEKITALTTKHLKMIKYTAEKLGKFEKMPKPPEERKANMKYSKKSCIVDDTGKANFLKKEIYIEGGNGKESNTKGTAYLKCITDKQGKQTWIRTGNPINDLTTLFRNFLIYKLTQQGGFKVRQFISTNGKYIFVIIYCSYVNLKVQASISSLNKQLSFCQSDIFSLEPVDSRLRPLRLNNMLKLDLENREVKQTMEELKQKKFEERYQKEVQPLKDHPIISNLEAFIDRKEENIKYQYQADEIERKYHLKQQLLKCTIQKLEENIKKQITDELANQPQTIQLGKTHDNVRIINPDLEELKLEIFRLLFSINLKQLSFETQCAYIESTEEIQENANEHFLVFTAYRDYLKIFNEKIQQLRKNFDHNNPLEISFYELQEIFSLKIKYNENDINGMIKKDKSFIKKSFILQETGQQFKLLLPALQLNQFIQFKMQQGIEKVFITSIQEVKKTPQGNLIKTIWDQYQIPYSRVFTDYLYTSSKQRVQNRIRQENQWNKQVINIDGKYDLFTKMQRIKLTYAILVNLFDFSKLKDKYNLIFSYFPLHDQFMLTGEEQYCRMFYEIWLREKKKDYLLKYDLKVEEQEQHLMQNKNLIKNKTFDENFYKQEFEKKIQSFKQNCLLLNWSGLIRSFNLPEEQIRDYFGEKIALYFVFLTFYIKKTFPVAILTIPVFIIQEGDFGGEDNGTLEQIFTIIYTLVVILWANIFCGQWNQRETQFVLKYGMQDVGDEENIRPGFKGQYVRSIVSDKLNELSYDKQETMKVEVVTWIIIIVLMIINGVIIYYLLYLQVWFAKNKSIENDSKSFIGLNILIPTLILQIIYSVLEYIYDYIIAKSCEKANYKTSQEYEKSYSTKIFILILFNHLMPPTLISFIINLEIGCVDEDCIYHLKTYVRSYQYYQILKQLKECAVPLYESIARKIKKTHSFIQGKNNQNNKGFELNINEQIEYESKLLSHQSTTIDHTTKDYINITCYFCFNVTYGLGFPLVFAISFLICCLKLFVSKKIYTKYTQRPIPENAKSIGIFKQFLDLGSSLSILTYSGVFSFTPRNGFESGGDKVTRLFVFVFLVLSFFGIKFIVNSLYDQVDRKTSELIRRQDYIIKKVIEGSKKGSQKSSNFEQQLPIMKVYGTYLEDYNAIKKQN